MYKDFSSLALKIKHCSAAIRQYKRIRKSCVLEIEELKEQFGSVSKKVVNLFNKIRRRALGRIVKLRIVKVKLLKRIIKIAPRIKKLKNKLPLAKSSLFAISHFHSLGNVASTVPSATGPGNAFLFDGVFTLLKKKKRFTLPRRLVVALLPDLLSNLRFKVKCESILKTYFCSSFAKSFKKLFIAPRKKLKRLPSRSAVINLTHLLPAIREAEFLNVKNQVKMLVRRRKRRSYVYSRSILPPVTAFKKFFFISDCVDEVLHARSRGKDRSYAKFLMRENRRVVEDLDERILFESFYTSFAAQVLHRSRRILRTNKHFYNLFIGLSGLVHKVKFQRNISVGPVSETAFSFRKFPLKKTV